MSLPTGWTIRWHDAPARRYPTFHCGNIQVKSFRRAMMIAKKPLPAGRVSLGSLTSAYGPGDGDEELDGDGEEASQASPRR